MGTYNICLDMEVDNKYSGCNLKTTELLDCTRIGVCSVIRSNTVGVLVEKWQIYCAADIIFCQSPAFRQFRIDPMSVTLSSSSYTAHFIFWVT